MVAGGDYSAESGAPAGWNAELLHSHAELLANRFTSLSLNLLIDKNKDINGIYIIKLL